MESSISLQYHTHASQQVLLQLQLRMNCIAHHCLWQVTCFPVSADERPAEEFSMP